MTDGGVVKTGSPTLSEEKPLGLGAPETAKPPTKESPSVKDTAHVTFSVEEGPAEEESAEKEVEPETVATPPDDDVVKSKVPPSESDVGGVEGRSEEVVGGDESERVQPTRKQNFHITALSILSPQPPKEQRPGTIAVPSSGAGTTASGAASSKQASSQSAKQSSSSKSAAPSPSPTPPLVISPALISAVSVSHGGRCTPTLLVYSIKSNRPIDKGKSEQKVKPPMPPPPDPLDYDPWEPIELVPSYMGNMPATSSTSSVLDVLSETKQDTNTSPADLKYLHSIPLDEFSCGTDLGTMPEITDVLPLAGGQLLAVLCNISSTSPLLAGSSEEEEVKEEDQAQGGEPSRYGGLLLFRTTIEEDGDRMRLRVDKEPVKVIRFYDHSSTVVSMCVIQSQTEIEERVGEKKQPLEAAYKEEGAQETDILLGTVTRKGDVIVYDCSNLDMNAIGHYSCRSDEQSCDPQNQSCDTKPVECIGCTYCPPTYHLAVADSSGHVTLLSIRELLLAREKLSEEEEMDEMENEGKIHVVFFTKYL